MDSVIDFKVSVSDPQPYTGQPERVLVIQLPVSLDLMPHLLSAVEKWHKRGCKVQGCGVYMGGSDSLMVLHHGVKAAPAEVAQ